MGKFEPGDFPTTEATKSKLRWMAQDVINCG